MVKFNSTSTYDAVALEAVWQSPEKQLVQDAPVVDLGARLGLVEPLVGEALWMVIDCVETILPWLVDAYD
jgi:hypothetical protein